MQPTTAQVRQQIQLRKTQQFCSHATDVFLTMLEVHISDQFQSQAQLHPCPSALHSILYQPSTHT